MLEGIKGVSTYAKDVDQAFIVVTVITLFLFVVTIGSMLFFIYRYRASKHSVEKTKNIKHYTPIEIAWTVIPTILMMVVFYYGLDSLRVQRTMPSDDSSITVKVTAQRWFWTFEYENGVKKAELFIPVDKNIKLIMTAPENDVLHAFYVPAFRAKEDIIPGQTTKLWFNANRIGKYDIQCAEYCGTRHSYMRSYVNVLSKEDYKKWLTPVKTVSTEVEEKSAMDIMTTLGCTGCHSFDGSRIVGPSLKDIYNKEVKVTTNGETKIIKRDELYLRNAILDSNKNIVDGFTPNLMPSFKDVIDEKDLDKVIEFLKNEKESKPIQEPKIDGKTVILNNGCTGCHSLDGSKIVGPSFDGIYNRKTKIMQNGSLVEVIADDKYIKNSINNPKVDVVDGYPNIMPPYKGILNNKEIDAIIDYFKENKK